MATPGARPMPPRSEPHAAPAPKAPLEVIFWGVRGSIASASPRTIRFGGNTTCLEVRAGGTRVIPDAGTGIRPLGDRLVAEAAARRRPPEATILFSHLHWDHIQGFPFFAPAFVPGADRLVLDAQYTPAEYEGRAGIARRGWGHSTWAAATAVARAVGARRLALFHHDPARDDAGLEGIELLAQHRFPGCFAAREGQRVAV